MTSKSSFDKKLKHPVTQYARDVLDDKILTGRLVRKACERHMSDLENGPARGIDFSVERADAAIGFIEKFLPLGDGAPFVQQPWQKFITGSIFGWVDLATQFRRFQQAYIETGKGSGKTPMLASWGDYGLLADGERDAEIYSAAPSMHQSRICYRDAELMIERSPSLRKRVVQTVNNLMVPTTNSFFRPISSERRSLDGPRVHMGLIDELHEHRDSIVYDKLRAGTKGRKQPLIIAITNSGYDRHSIAWRLHDYSVKLLQGVFQNDSFFSYVCQLDPCKKCQDEGKDQPTDGCADCDDWRDEATWLKANPNLDVSISRSYLRQQVQEAVEMPGKQNIVKRLNFCMWTSQSVRWLNLDLWDRGANVIPLASMAGRKAYLGMDLAKTCDMSAVAILFPPMSAGEPWKLIMRYWVPEDDVEARVRRDRVPYDTWIRDGYIATTPGNATDFGFIEAEILKLCGLYSVAEVAYDRTFADSMVQRLMNEGITMVEFPQNFTSMTAPCAELERLLLSGQLQHGGNPVLRWNASNVSVIRDSYNNMRPDKVGSTERIDGITALLNALGRAMGAAVAEPEYQMFFIG